MPGSIGGALRMNAGSAEVGIWDRVLWAEAMTATGDRVRIQPEEASPGYRSVALPDEWVFVGARFAAPPGDPDGVNAAHAERRRRKVQTQVYELPSCGSIWKNPGEPYGSAWEVVDRAGMRGAVRGGAQITERHANFIANVGGATAADVLWLMAETRRRVHDLDGVLAGAGDSPLGIRTRRAVFGGSRPVSRQTASPPGGRRSRGRAGNRKSGVGPRSHAELSGVQGRNCRSEGIPLRFLRRGPGAGRYSARGIGLGRAFRRGGPPRDPSSDRGGARSAPGFNRVAIELARGAAGSAGIGSHSRAGGWHGEDPPPGPRRSRPRPTDPPAGDRRGWPGGRRRFPAGALRPREAGPPEP